MLIFRLLWEKAWAWFHGWKVTLKVGPPSWPGPDGRYVAHWAYDYPPALVERTRTVWSKVLKRPISEDDAKYILQDFSTFFKTLRTIKAVRDGK